MNGAIERYGGGTTKANPPTQAAGPELKGSSFGSFLWSAETGSPCKGRVHADTTGRAGLFNGFLTLRPQTSGFFVLVNMKWSIVDARQEGAEAVKVELFRETVVLPWQEEVAPTPAKNAPPGTLHR